MERSRLRTDDVGIVPDGADRSAPATTAATLAAPEGAANVSGATGRGDSASAGPATGPRDSTSLRGPATPSGSNGPQPIDPSASATATASGESDRTLVERLAAGDSTALEALYDRHAPILHALSLKLLGDHGAAEEVVQDAFWRLWTRPERYDAQRGTPRAFLVQMARSRALDRLRRADRRARLLEPTDELVDAVVADPTGPLDVPRASADVEAAVEVRRALERLSLSQRRAVVLSYYYGMTHDEIAKRLAEPVGTVKSRIRRGLLRLHRFLGAGGGGGGGS